jgi:plastocyanin
MLKLSIWIAISLAALGGMSIPGEPFVQPAAAGIYADSATVKISNFKFEPKAITIAAGSSVKWVDEGGKHSVESDTGVFKSPALTQGQEFEFKFDKPGTYPYHCGFHGDVGGKDMAGTVVVRPRGKP